MIHALELTNFRSFREFSRLDFTAKPNKADCFGYRKLSCGTVVSKLIAVYGANASGKSNLLKAIGLIKRVVVDSGINDKFFEAISELNPFAVEPFKSSPVRLAIEFSDGGEEVFRYDLELNSSIITFEKLSVINASVDSVVFERICTLKGVFKFAHNAGGEWTSFRQRTNSSLIASAVISGEIPGQTSAAYKLAVRIQNYFSNLAANVYDSFGMNDVGVRKDIFEIGAALQSNDKLMKCISRFLRRSDLGAKSLAVQVHNFTTKDGREEKLHFPMIAHTLMGQEVTFMFGQESSGTQNMLSLMTELIPHAISGHVLALDEIENGLHPHIIPEILQEFLSIDGEAQLILATHSDYLMRDLNHDQVFVCNKDSTGNSSVETVENIPGFKSDRNLLSWYHAKKLGGVPKI